jgi:very-short-patch-repair endonuclease
MRGAEAIARLSAVAAPQLGLFTRDDARKDDISKHQLRRMVEHGVVERVGPAVFRFAASPRSWRQDVMVAVLDGGPECVASHRTAAALHGFDGFAADVIEVLVPMSVFHRRKNVVVHHTRSLPSMDRTVVGVIPVTSRTRTLIDLGAVSSAETVENALDCAERDRKVQRAELERRYLDLKARGRNGIGAMTQILDARLELERLPRSVLEREMSRLLRRAGLAVPIGSYRVRLSPTLVYELDFAYVSLRLGLELDGHGSHATRRQRAADNVRANDLGDAGWTLRRFTYEQVMYEPAAVAEAVRAALQSCRSRRPAI